MYKILRSSSFLSVLVVIFYSCEKDKEIIKKEEPLIIHEALIDTIYTDEGLSELLEEELEFIKSSNTSGKSNVPGMDIYKQNSKKVYVHYMPWFQSKDYDGYWGQHWTMSNQDPDIEDEDGVKQIASYYYPLIGPYSSADPNLQIYHFLLMKLSGVDGVIFDWYGSNDIYDYGLIKDNIESSIKILEDLGLKFSVMYEDRAAFQSVSESSDIIDAAQKDLLYINNNYFTSQYYMKHNGNNLLFVFGPNYITDSESWNQIFEILPLGNRPEFLTLWNASVLVGENATGEFLWVDKEHLVSHDHFYYGKDIGYNEIIVGSSYPGFKSFYTEGGWSDGVNDWVIDTDNGYTFSETLNYTHHEISDFIQIITWNDFGEGTMIEPTQEFGFTFLNTLQQYTRVPFTESHLKLALEIYRIRKRYENNADVQSLLDRSFQYTKQLELRRVHKLLSAIKRFY